MNTINLENIPIKIGKNGKKFYNWCNAIGQKIDFEYKGITGVLTIKEYLGRKLVVTYNNEDRFINSTSLQKCGLSEIINPRLYNYKYAIGDHISDNNRDIIITNRKTEKGRRYYQYKCLSCNFDCHNFYKFGEYQEDFWIAETDLNKGMGCTLCRKGSRIVVSGYNDVTTTDPWMVSYFIYGNEEAKKYSNNCSKIIKLKCPDCGNIKYMSLNTLYRQGFSCICSDNFSYSEKFIYKLLTQLNVNFQFQLSNKTFSWVQSYRYDFYLPDYNAIIETHGIQHYQTKSDKWITSGEQQKIDKEKMVLAKENGIQTYIVLDCRRSDINWLKKEIEKSSLSDFVDLSIVNYNQCHEFSLKSLTKEVCTYYENNKNNTTIGEIARLFKISNETVSKYLSLGEVNQWCTLRKGKFNGAASTKKPLKIMYNNQQIYFDSCSNCIKYLKENFGIHISNTYINKYSKLKTEYKNILFDFISKEEFNYEYNLQNGNVFGELF